MKRKRFIFLISIIVILAVSCQNRVVHEHQIEIENENWSTDNRILSHFEINDTTNSYTIFLNIYTKENYPFGNLYLFINTIMPDSLIIRDTLNCSLADVYGNWLGKEKFGIIENKLPYKVNVRFPVKGIYKIEIEQAMRKEHLEGVYSVGLQIEK